MFKYKLKDFGKQLVKALRYAIQLAICIFVGISAMSFIAQFGIQLAVGSARAGLVDTALGFVIIGAMVGGSSPLAAFIGYKLFGWLSKLGVTSKPTGEDTNGKD